MPEAQFLRKSVVAFASPGHTQLTHGSARAKWSVHIGSSPSPSENQRPPAWPRSNVLNAPSTPLPVSNCAGKTFPKLLLAPGPTQRLGGRLWLDRPPAPHPLQLGLKPSPASDSVQRRRPHTWAAPLPAMLAAVPVPALMHGPAWSRWDWWSRGGPARCSIHAAALRHPPKRSRRFVRRPWGPSPSLLGRTWQWRLGAVPSNPQGWVEIST